MDLKHRLQRQVLIAPCRSYGVVILDTSIVNVALESIARDRDAGITALQWVINAYPLSFASLLLTGGLPGGGRFGARARQSRRRRPGDSGGCLTPYRCCWKNGTNCAMASATVSARSYRS